MFDSCVFFQVGKIDEIFGTLRDYFVSVNLSDTVKAKSFEKDQTLYIDPAKLLPLKMFLPGGDKKRKCTNNYYFFIFRLSFNVKKIT